MGADCKSAGSAYAGSNPARPKKVIRLKQSFNRTKSFLVVFLYVAGC